LNVEMTFVVREWCWATNLWRGMGEAWKGMYPSKWVQAPISWVHRLCYERPHERALQPYEPNAWWVQAQAQFEVV